MKTKVVFVILSGLVFTSCSVFKYSSRIAEMQTQNNIYITPSVVDVKIDLKKKISVVSNPQKTEESARENAYYKAITENDIDILVSPIYEIEVMSSGTCTAKVTGFAGYFENPRTIVDEKKLAYDAKIEALQKMLKLDPIVKEEQKTIIVAPGNTTTGNNSNNGVTTISTPQASLIEKFMILYNTESPSTNVSTTPASTPSISNSFLNMFKK